MSDSKIKKSVSYKVLIKSGKRYFDVGTIIIKVYKGDILYIPSSKFLVTEDSTKKEVDHISWHATGRVHIKYKTGLPDDYSIIQKKGERQKISEIGFQEMMKDTINYYDKLPEYKRKVTGLDVVFDVKNYGDSVCFNFSMLSGKLIVAQYKGLKVPIKSLDSERKHRMIDSSLRALGHHSGSGDVMLQYSLEKIRKKQLRTNRQLFIPHDMKISKLGYKL